MRKVFFLWDSATKHYRPINQTNKQKNQQIQPTRVWLNIFTESLKICLRGSQILVPDYLHCKNSFDGFHYMYVTTDAIAKLYV